MATIDKEIDFFPIQPSRYFLLAGAPSFPDCYLSNYNVDAGGMSKHTIISQLEECACTLNSKTFISISHNRTKSYLLEKACNIQQNACNIDSTARVGWNIETLKTLCSVYVLIFEENKPASVLFKQLTRNKKADIHSCDFAFALFDNYILINYPNYYYLMCSFFSDPTHVSLHVAMYLPIC